MSTIADILTAEELADMRQAELDAGAEPTWYELLDANLPEGFRARVLVSPQSAALVVTGPNDYEQTHEGTLQGQYEALSTAWSAAARRTLAMAEALDTGAFQATLGGHPDGDPYAYKTAMRKLIAYMEGE